MSLGRVPTANGSEGECGSRQALGWTDGRCRLNLLDGRARDLTGGATCRPRARHYSEIPCPPHQNPKERTGIRRTASRSRDGASRRSVPRPWRAESQAAGRIIVGAKRFESSAVWACSGTPCTDAINRGFEECHAEMGVTRRLAGGAALPMRGRGTSLGSCMTGPAAIGSSGGEVMAKMCWLVGGRASPASFLRTFCLLGYPSCLLGN